MKLRIDLQSPVPVYRQIVDSLRFLLVEGELKPGDQLPPVRRLAMDLGIHFNTVAAAYRTLAEEGWLEIARRSGAEVVSRAKPRGADPEVLQGFQQRLRELVADLRAHGVSSRRIARELRQLAETLERV